jgi:hypothetical protein
MINAYSALAYASKSDYQSNSTEITATRRAAETHEVLYRFR